MVLFDALHWFTSETGLMAIIAENWVTGMLIVSLVIFLETGVVVMPFLPGDSLLFTAGAFLGAAGVPIEIPVAMTIGAAILGDACNYGIGRSALGQQIVRRHWIRPAHMDLSRSYFARYGGPTITIGRFVPIVRSIAPFMAGLSQMDARRFLAFNILGAILWAGGLLLAGYWLGRIEWVRANLGWVTVGIVVLSLVPIAMQLVRHSGR